MGQGRLGSGRRAIRPIRPREPRLRLTKGGREALQPVGGEVELGQAAQASDLRGQSIQKVLGEIEALQAGQGPQCCGQRLQAVVGGSEEGEGGEGPQGLRQL